MSPVNQFEKPNWENNKNVSYCIVQTAVEPRFNKVPRVWENLFVISRVRRYIENPDLTNFLKKKQNVRYIEGSL